MSPLVIGDDPGSGITSTELGGYAGSDTATYAPTTQTFSDKTTGDQTTQEAQVVSYVEEKLDAIVEGWVDSGGPGGYQQAVAREVLRRAALLQGDMVGSVRQWARPGRERALLEMMSVLTKAIVDRDRLLLELRERLNASPY